MKIIRCSGYNEMSHSAAGDIAGEIRMKPALWLCAATGYSPRGTYRELVAKHQRGEIRCDALGIVKLDEWWGIPEGGPGSCEAYLNKELLSPLGLSRERYISFNSDARDPEQECLRVQDTLTETGPVDICLLGLGKNGHLGLNEPASSLSPYCHVSRLAAGSKQHAMLASLEEKPGTGLTLGMADILRARRILLLICGEGKEEAFKAFMQQKIYPGLPVSMLWMHPDVRCYVDASSVS
jgi:galactosamine-6-phosphate isomerase